MGHGSEPGRRGQSDFADGSCPPDGGGTADDSPKLASRVGARLRRTLVPSVNVDPRPRPIDNGKPVARRGRKATGLTKVAGLPNRRWTVEVQGTARARLAHAAMTLGAVLAMLLTAAASVHR